MKPIDALRILDEVAAKAHVSRPRHVAAQQAVGVLLELINAAEQQAAVAQQETASAPAGGAPGSAN